MEVIIIYISVHWGNTEKIAKGIAETLNGKLVKVNEVIVDELPKYKLVGVGSGIYYGKHHKELIDFVDKLPPSNGQKVFIFSTAGYNLNWLWHRELKKKLSKKGFDIVGEFSCKGFTTYGPYRLIGGINKGRPNEKDLEDARKFAHQLKLKVEGIREE